MSHSIREFCASGIRWQLILQATCLAVIGGALKAQNPVPPTWGGPPPPLVYSPSVHGSWSPNYDWTSFFNLTAQLVDDAEIGHATLVTSGPHRGKVLLWNIDAPLSGQNPTVQTFIFDPRNPRILSEMVQNPNFTSDIFCSGMSTLSDGKLLVCGGFQLVFATPTAPTPAPIESYLFDPLLIDAGTPWQFPAIVTDSTGVPLEARFYPSLIPLSASYGNKQLLIGGQGSLDLLPGVPEVRSFDETTSQYSAGILAPLIASGGSDYHPEKYPRAFHLSTGDVFVVGDAFGNPAGLVITPGGAQHILALPRNQLTTFPGDTFFMHIDKLTGLPTSVTLGPRLDEDLPLPSPILPLPNANPSPVGYRDLNFGSTVLLHCQPANGGLDRVLVFGGSGGWSKAAEDFIQQFSYPVEVYDRVQELSVVGASGDWHDKTPMNIKRTCLNAVVLPTREIFLSGGSAVDPLTYGKLDLVDSTLVGQDAHGFWQPVFLSEIYDPGRGATVPGTTKYAALPKPNSVLADDDAGPNDVVDPLFPWTPRIYHHVSILLPDGSVFVGGGSDADFDEVAFGVFMAAGNQSAEIYYPPYFSQPRSNIEWAPSTTAFASKFKVSVNNIPANHVVEQFVLIKTGTMTHHFDSDQRYIELTHASFASSMSGTQAMLVKAPDKKLGPAGFYLLFAITTDGTVRTPSKGVFIKLK